MKKKCKIKNCFGNHYGFGFCRVHYRRFKKYGDPNAFYGTTHKMTGTKIYAVWKGMKQRCNYKKAKNYKNYGGRGIAVCAEWEQSFESFYKDMGDPPKTERYTIERIDNNLGYYKENCKWATYLEQSQNTRGRKNKHGLAGVYKTRNTYYSMIVYNHKRKYLGSFKTAEEANSAYILEKTKNGKQC